MPEDKGIGVIPLTPLAEFKKGNNYLFAIGINTYQDFAPLSNARKDVEDVADVLVRDYYFERQNIRFLCDDEATKDNIIEELTGLSKKIKENDRLLIYYSGHGHLEGKRGFWIPVNAKRDRMASYIANAEVRDIIQDIKARHILLISDSCFSANLLVRDATRDIGGAFTDWERNPSRWIFISGKGIVSDGIAGTNSPFAKAILKHLHQNSDDMLNIVDLANRVTKEVRYNYEQQADIMPLYQSGHEGGQFVFVKRQTEKDDWATALRLDTEGGYLSYLEKYPQGRFEKDAEKKLEEIADEREWHKADLRDAAFAYRDYLKKYPKGKHSTEANTRLQKITTKEAERIAKIEADKKEAERLAKLETDRKEAERIAKIEADRKETERLAKLEADRKEAERIAKIEADKKEAKLEANRKENEAFENTLTTSQLKYKRKIDTTLVDLNNKSKEIEDEGSFFKKYKFVIGGSSSVLVTSLLIWQMTKQPPTPSVSPTTEPVTQQPIVDNTNTQQGVKTIDPKTLPPSVTVQKPADKPTTQTVPSKPAVDPKIEANKQAEANRIAEQNRLAEEKRKTDEANKIAEQKKQQQIQADKTAAQKYLKTAFANVNAGEWDTAKDALSNAAKLSSLSAAAKKAISTALANVNAEETKAAKDAINQALNATN